MSGQLRLWNVQIFCKLIVRTKRPHDSTPTLWRTISDILGISGLCITLIHLHNAIYVETIVRILTIRFLQIFYTAKTAPTVRNHGGSA
jgi:hypothetical protein